MNRLEMLKQINDVKEWDVVIIGGGATGLGAALDAATRGYKTLLVEQYDFGKGTSSRSTKLVHGGVRYLAQGNLKLVTEALRERGWLLQNAPHLTSAMQFVIPVYNWYSKLYYGAGLKMYDVLAGKLRLGKTKLLNKQETLQHLPGLKNRKLFGGVVYYDGQFDDARLIIALALTAAKHGATVINYCKVKSLLKAGKKVCGIIAEDTFTRNTYEIKVKAVINATGVFTDAIMQMDDEKHENIVAPSQGIHLVVNKEFFPGNSALMIPKTDDSRVLFAVPWHGKVVLGTTDTPVSNVSAEPKPLDEEVEFVIKHANRYLERSITPGDIKSIFAGLRPLVKKREAAKTSVLKRDHIIIVSKSNLISITGGKWTTYRKMAEDVINYAARVAKLHQRNCITNNLALDESQNILNNKEDILHESFPYAHKHIDNFVCNEMAITVEDVLARRTRLLFLDAQAAINVAPTVAKAIAAIMNKDEDWINGQIKAFTQLASQYKL